MKKTKRKKKKQSIKGNTDFRAETSPRKLITDEKISTE